MNPWYAAFPLFAVEARSLTGGDENHQELMIPTETSAFLQHAVNWPFAPMLSRLGMSVGMGVFIGLEREHSQKAGVRTFTLTALTGCLGGAMGTVYSVVALAFCGMSVAWMNYRQMQRQQKLALTTSIALTLSAFCGVLFGQGHVFTPAVAGILTAALLAWKQPISRFAIGLTDKELRSAILLAILTFVILPVLPDHAVDPWGLIEPRSNWLSVIIIAGIGFINYILMKLMGARGMEITAFFGGLVNSRKVIVELAGRLRESGAILLPTVYRGILLATAAMLLRNGLIVVFLAPRATLQCILPLALMILVNALLWRRVPAVEAASGEPASLVLESPFRLSAALKFGLVFLILNVVGALAQRQFGAASFYFVSMAGGLLSSASSIASAATLMARNEISMTTGVNGIILSSLTSILINVPLVRGLTRDARLKRQIAIALAVIAGMGLIGVVANHILFA
ncbi:putative membrane protein [Opitutaceae bacterium TAV1]|nr:putative membrane protein [Opitutaceae bacterium TAV1]